MCYSKQSYFCVFVSYQYFKEYYSNITKILLIEISTHIDAYMTWHYTG